jgi:hypothetical protein
VLELRSDKSLRTIREKSKLVEIITLHVALILQMEDILCVRNMSGVLQSIIMSVKLLVSSYPVSVSPFVLHSIEDHSSYAY